MENLEKTKAIRQYRKSTIPRLRWTPELHRSFVEAVHCLGGKYQATPKKIMQMMAVTGLKISHIKSHLQMYRSMRESTIYKEKRPNLRKFCQEFREDEKLNRRNIRMGTNVMYHEYQNTQDTSTNKITKESPEIQGANMELHKKPELNLLSLGNSPVNLDLTISSH